MSASTEIIAMNMEGRRTPVEVARFLRDGSGTGPDGPR